MYLKTPLKTTTMQLFQFAKEREILQNLRTRRVQFEFLKSLCTLTMCIIVGQQFAAMRGTSMFPPVGCLAFPSHTSRGHGQLCALGVARCQHSVKLNSIGLFCLLLESSPFHSAQMSPNDP